MLQIQLYIENDQGALEEVELYKDESVTLTQAIQDVKDIEKVFTDYSKTFNIPASKKNNKFFKHFYNYYIDGFDARRKKRAELYLNYKPFKKGKIKLEGTTLKNNEAHTYKVTFFGNTITLKDLIGEDKLGNLTLLDGLNFYYNDTNIQNYLTDGAEGQIGGNVIDDAIIFPLITHTNRLTYDSGDTSAGTYNMFYSVADTNAHGVYFNQLKPALRVYAIIKAIEFKYNIQFSEDFFSKTNPAFYNLYMWLHNKEGSIFEDQEGQFTVSGFSNVRGDITEIYGVHNAYFSNTFDTEKQRRKIIVKVTPSSNDEYSLVIKKNGEELNKYSGLTGTTYNGEAEVNEVEIPNGDYTFFIESTNVATYDVDITIVDLRKRTFAGTKTSKITFTGAAGVIDTQHFNISSNIPSMKTLDFITGLFKMFNLTSYINDDGVIVVQPLDDYFASSQQTWDITEHLDKSATVVDSVIPYRQVNLSYKGRESFLAKNHETTNNKAWGTLEYAASDNFEGEAYNIELPFEHFKYERLIDENTGDKTGVQYGWSVDSKQEPNIGEPLLFYATKAFITIPAVNIAGDRVNIESPYLPSNSVQLTNLFGDQSQSLNFHAEFDEFTWIPNTNTLFQTYYKNYIADLFDKRKRLTMASAFLPLSITQKLTLADKVIIFDKIYRINKITTNFETNRSELELTNILEERSFAVIKGSEPVDISSDLITADTTIYTADLGNLLADGLLIPPETTEVPNTIPTNDVTPPTNEPCIVTAATIVGDGAISYCDKIEFKAEITAAGTICGVDHIDEYGFLLASNSSYLTASDDIDTLKADSNIQVIATIRNAGAPSLTVGEKVATKTGLTDPATYYARFYVRTNTSDLHAEADAITSLLSESTDCGIYGTADNTNLTVDDTDTYTADVGDTDGDGTPEALASRGFLSGHATVGTSYSSIPTLSTIELDATNTCDEYATHQIYYHNGTGVRPIVGDSVKIGSNDSANYNNYAGGTNSAPASFINGSDTYYVINLRQETSLTLSSSYISGYAVVNYNTAKVVAVYECPAGLCDASKYYAGGGQGTISGRNEVGTIGVRTSLYGLDVYSATSGTSKATFIGIMYSNNYTALNNVSNYEAAVADYIADGTTPTNVNFTVIENDNYNDGGSTVSFDADGFLENGTQTVRTTASAGTYYARIFFGWCNTVRAVSAQILITKSL